MDSSNRESLPVSYIRQFCFCPRIPFLSVFLEIKPPSPLWVQDGVDFHEKAAMLQKRRKLSKFNLSGKGVFKPNIYLNTPTWPRSFMPTSQTMRNKVAKMKLIPVHDLIEGKKLLFVDDSIVRGTQMRETVEFLYENGAKEVHMRSACPPIMYGCKYLNFSRSTSELELIARQIIDEHEGIDGIKYIHEYSNSNTERGKLLRDEICRRLKLTSLEFQSLEGTVQAVGKPECQLCSYCWSGRE